MKPRICVSLPAKNFSNLVSMIHRAEDMGADLIEVRLDFLKFKNLKASDIFGKIVDQASVPLIATNRQLEQGGRRNQREDFRVQTLIKAAEAGFEYIDIELTTADLRGTIQKLREKSAKPIVSFHDLEKTPAEAEMEQIVKLQVDAGAEVCKFITTANDISDNIRCLELTKKMSHVTKIVCFAMGRTGILSRILSPLYGAFFTYAALRGELETASGQISIAELRRLYRKLGVLE